MAPGALCPLLSIPCCPAQDLQQQLPAKLSCISWRHSSSQIREPKTQMCKKPTGQVLVRLCGWLVHRRFISQDSSWVGCHVAVGGSDSSADIPGGGAEAPTGPLQGSSCLRVSLIPCWVRQTEQRLHPVDIFKALQGGYSTLRQFQEWLMPTS